jgi:hypothetical protein
MRNSLLIFFIYLLSYNCLQFIVKFAIFSCTRLEKISGGKYRGGKSRGGKFLQVLPYCKKFSAIVAEKYGFQYVHLLICEL